ncbi:aldehyde dehydrogenase family protein [Mycolicibacterium tokaiense]|jgi:benzaldehyde dehydrogenase (NAD)|uniref:Benzaldehyde dehydrogenase II n=1 Tax=Mycolicibacterium tokaiense TaxID=39695 RepID=A0A378TEF5_9MYCO|nr:aldehyde dehydrogenase family protein [Mycolicibacterium tokaiense]BBY86601.1 benzaldehyde dehydrogenase [Mycolicibacterium tokaiense]STZ58894.1 benzaldehyde dehydrogenase II [Mycolicibacterium tokaiense]
MTLSGSLQRALFIDGEFVGSDGEISPVTDKASGEVIGESITATDVDVDRAVAGAVAAQREWYTTPATERAAILRRGGAILEREAGRFKEILIREGGAIGPKAEGEIGASVIEFFQAAELATTPLGEIIPSGQRGRVNIVERRPVGVVGLITAWNAPVHIAMRVLAPAIALGNTVVLKPAPETPFTGGLMLAEVLAEAGLPAGVVQVLTGGPAGARLVSHPQVDMIHFTGSEDTGRRINVAAAPLLKRVALELGGNNASIVLSDADVELAARCGAGSSFGHQGQVCIATGRHIVLADVAADYVAALSAEAAKLTVGDPYTAAVDLGPMLSQRQVDKALAMVSSSVELGARVVEGGTADGVFLRPTVVDQVRPGMVLHDEEVFAPIAPVTVVDSVDEALKIVNGTRFGLSTAVFSRDLDTAWSVADQVRSGMVHVNDGTALHESQVPFGGTAASGLGDDLGGRANIDLLTERRWTSLQRNVL